MISLSEFFQNFTCKVYVADAKKHCTILGNLSLNRGKLISRGNICQKGALFHSFLCQYPTTFTCLSNFFWPRKDLGETVLPNLIKPTKSRVLHTRDARPGGL